MIRTVMPYSLKDAAEASGKSKPTILRAIQNGKVSAEKDAHGEWQIEPAELHRVYPVVTVRTGSDGVPFNDTQHSNSAYETGVLQGQLEQLRERLAVLDTDRERERREAAEQINFLRTQLEQAETERRAKDQQLTALLTDQTAKTEAEPAATPAPEPAPSPTAAPAIQTAARKGLGSWLHRLAK